jgi:2-(3-amino-3-carboxypropyl)histidine synthase
MDESYTLEKLRRSHEIEIEWLAEELDRRDLDLVGLQLPDGIRGYGPAIAEWIEDEVGVETVISGDPSFGACDLALSLERLGADLLVHFGHSPMPSIEPIDEFDVLYVPTYSKVPVADTVRKAGKELSGKTVGVLTTAQHSAKMDEMREVLEAEGCSTEVGLGDDRVINPGQLLGCNFTAAQTVADKVDAFLYVGSGDFHPIAAAWGMDIELYVADPMQTEVRQVNDRIEEMMRQRYATIAKAEDGDSFGILVGTRVGQMRQKYARGLVKLCRRNGYEAHLIALDFFTPEALENFRNLDAFVNTACPRITTDDYAMYDAPILTPQELEIVLGRREWEDYKFDEFKGTKPAPHHDERAETGEKPVLGEET